ncbi:MAG: Isocitrate dehydrogenase [NADP], mitochondrial precursor (Oxalosuccinate decarboxylase) [Chaenotheca gracillima]|nr:MAG: Isocitrate dehydrogenase [NADP], mitochondrial precursor (Oxalosuccinate decarboxylase) [Chaenotheca gracillima]
MVVLLDLEEHALRREAAGSGASSDSLQRAGGGGGGAWKYLTQDPAPVGASLTSNGLVKGAEHEHGEERMLGKEAERRNPNLNSFTQAMGCYPRIISQITRSLDRNSLHDLARTCRQVRANILPFRRQLVAQSLSCFNEELDSVSLQQLELEHDDLSLSTWPAQAGNATTGQGCLSRKISKVSRCARDMVGECRKCGTVVCRNCIVKPPPPSALAGRHRRLCNSCLAAPIDQHVSSRSRQTCPSSWRNRSKPDPDASKPTFTSQAFDHDPCSCPDSVWLCQACGLSLPSADTTYHRVWAWRTRYGAYLGAYLGGGVGTGLVKGNEGVQCGRNGDCLAAKEIEVEVDCDAVDLANAAAAAAAAAATTTVPPSVAVAAAAASASEQTMWERNRNGRQGYESDEEKGPSYERQEIEGIGGVVKKKIKRMEPVGKVVNEWSDEREAGGGGWMGREKRGEQRSWCGWCGRVVPGKKDRGILGLE